VAEAPRPPALAGDQAQPLNPEEAAAWEEVTGKLTNLAQRLKRGDPVSDEDLRLPALDQDRVLNALHVPPDAGEYAGGLERILRRIPDGWGRWIGCDRGWWPLIIRLNDRLSSLDPLYRLEQVKEKLGGLRYYIQTNSPHAAAMESLIDEAEAESETVCESCSAAGVLRVDDKDHWLKTLCPDCAHGTGYRPVRSGEA
jgi:hypothetical protein